jgi:hypothetical protein
LPFLYVPSIANIDIVGAILVIAGDDNDAAQRGPALNRAAGEHKIRPYARRDSMQTMIRIDMCVRFC